MPIPRKVPLATFQTLRMWGGGSCQLGRVIVSFIIFKIIFITIDITIIIIIILVIITIIIVIILVIITVTSVKYERGRCKHKIFSFSWFHQSSLSEMTTNETSISFSRFSDTLLYGRSQSRRRGQAVRKWGKIREEISKELGKKLSELERKLEKSTKETLSSETKLDGTITVELEVKIGSLRRPLRNMKRGVREMWRKSSEKSKRFVEKISKERRQKLDMENGGGPGKNLFLRNANMGRLCENFES